MASTLILWEQISLPEPRVATIGKITNKAKAALEKSVGILHTVQFIKCVESISRPTVTMPYITVLPAVPANLDDFYQTFEKNFKKEVMSVSAKVLTTRREGSVIVVAITYPHTIKICFELIAQTEADDLPENDRHKFSGEGQKALACMKRTVRRDPVWTANLPDWRLRNLMRDYDEEGETKGQILFHSMTTLSNLVAVPTLFEGMNDEAREHIAQGAQGYLDDPTLLIHD